MQTDRDRLTNLIINAKRTDPETGSFCDYLAEFLLAHGVMLPTLTPNESLTLEQLREMDGEPVWFDTIKRWGIVKVCRDGVFVLTKSGEFEVGRCKYYRSPPEGEANGK